MRVVSVTLLLLAATTLSAWDWFIMRPAEFITAHPALIEVGFPTVGIQTGTVETGQGSEGYCLFMQDGHNWNACPAALGGKMSFIVMAQFRDPFKMYGIQFSIQGFNAIIQFVHADNFQTVYAVNTFNSGEPLTDMSVSEYPLALQYRDGKLWLGNKSGKVLISTDEGVSWTPHVITTDTQVEISSIRMISALNGWATGGRITEESGFEPKITIEPKGGLWETADGGESWTPVFSGLALFPVEAAKDANGKWYVRMQDADNIATDYEKGDSLQPETKLIYATDNFAAFTGWSDTAYDMDIGGQNFSSYNVPGLGVTDDLSEVWLGGFFVAGLSGTPVSLTSTDGGNFWVIRNMPQGSLGFKLFNFKDPEHVYAAGGQKNIFKCGDPNENWVYQPDDDPVTDNEQPDESVTDDTATDDVPDQSDLSDGSDPSNIADAEPGDDSDALLLEEGTACGCTLAY